MSECREAFFQHHGAWPEAFTTQTWLDWQAAWNARGKVDARICLETRKRIEIDSALYAAEAIEQEDEK